MYIQGNNPHSAWALIWDTSVVTWPIIITIWKLPWSRESYCRMCFWAKNVFLHIQECLSWKSMQTAVVEATQKSVGSHCWLIMQCDAVISSYESDWLTNDIISQKYFVASLTSWCLYENGLFLNLSLFSSVIFIKNSWLPP